MRTGRFYYKANVLAMLKEAGYSQNRLRVENILGQATITKLREGQNDMVSWRELEKLCNLLDVSMFDLIEDRGTNGSEKPMFVERVDEHGNEVYTLNPAAAGDPHDHEQDDEIHVADGALLDDFTDDEVQRIAELARYVADDQRKRNTPLESDRRDFWLYEVMLTNAEEQIAVMLEKYAKTRGKGGVTDGDGANGDET